MPRAPGRQRNRQRRPAWVVLLGLLLLAALTLASRAGWLPAGGSTSDTRTTVAFLDVGQALAVAVVTEDGHALLYDAGNSARDVREVIAPFFEARGIRTIDYLVLSHPDQDHVGGMPDVIDRFTIGTFVDPALPSTNLAYLETLERVLDRGIPAQRARRGQTLTLGADVHVRVLWPSEPLRENRDGEPSDNDNSVVLQIVHGEVRILLTGDIEAPAERALLERDGDALQADILQVPHHGSQTSTTPELLDAVRPTIAVIPVGRDNPYGHPHRDVIDRLRLAGVTVYRTDIDGTVTITSDGTEYRVETARGVLR